jgi:CRISPR-associated exonuclease Cas4
MAEYVFSSLFSAVQPLASSGQGSNPVAVTLICLGAVVLVALAVLLFNEYRAWRRRPPTAKAEKKGAPGLPKGEIVYTDADGSGEPLLATSYPLSGKPDYVILSPDGVPIPVELKLDTRSEEAQPHHLMQVATYFVILEDLYPQPPTYGLLRYANKDITIPSTDALKRKLLRRLAEMERSDEQHPPALTYQLVSKCRTCPFQPICPIGQLQER